MIPKLFFVIIALTLVYFLAKFAYEYLIRKRLSLDTLVKDILITIFFSIISFFLINPSDILLKLNINPSLFDTNFALEKLNLYFQQSKLYLDFIVSTSFFIAITDLIISITALMSLSALNILSVYQFYTHQILGVLESLASLIGLIIIIIQALTYLLKISLNLKSILDISLFSLIPPKFRHLGKIILVFYVFLYFILPFIVNYSINYSNLSYFSYNYPSNFTAIKVRVKDYTNSPVLLPVLLHLKGENFSKHYILKVYDSKQIYLFTREYKASSVYIYWYNLSNSGCCYNRESYSYCYNCFISPATLDLRNRTQKELLISLPFTVLPCNNDIGVSGLVYAYIPNGGNVVGKKLYDKIVFHVTPRQPKLIIMVSGGNYSLEYQNNSNWTLYVKVKNIKWFPTYNLSFMEKLLQSENAWWNRTGLNHYEEMINKYELPQNPTPENIKEYMLIVYLKNKGKSNATESVTFNITISGKGCWNPNIIYFDDWNEIDDVFWKINLIKNWVSATYRLIINIVIFIIIFITSLYILLNYSYSTNTISRFFVYVLRNIFVHIYPIFRNIIYNFSKEIKETNKKELYDHDIKSLKKKQIMYMFKNYYRIYRIRNKFSKIEKLYTPIYTKIEKNKSKKEFYSIIKNPYRYSKAYCYYIYKKIFHDSDFKQLIKNVDKEKILFKTDPALLGYIDHFELSRLILLYIGVKTFPEKSLYFLKVFTEFKEKIKANIEHLMKDSKEYNALISYLDLDSIPNSPDDFILVLEKKGYLPDLDYIYLDAIKTIKKLYLSESSKDNNIHTLKYFNKYRRDEENS